jgi:hypothetical protein
MKTSPRFTGTILIMAALVLTACQAAPTPTPTAVPTNTPVPSATPAPTATPAHPAVKPDAPRLDFSKTTMFAGPGDVQPGDSMQVVFTGEAGRKIKIQTTIDSGTGAALSLWGADGAVLLPETNGITGWEGVLPKVQDYYLSLHNTSQAPFTYSQTITMPPVTPPAATRIQFQPNTTGWYTPGEVLPNQPLRFVLGAMGGQTLNAAITTVPQNGAYLNVWAADGTVFTGMSPTQEVSIKLPAQQDYYVEIIPVLNQTVTYQLSVNIPAGQTPTQAPAGQTVLGARIAKDQSIRFDTSPVNVTLDGAVISGERDRYTLSLLAGETLDVIVTSVEGNAVFTIIGPDGNPLPGTEEGKDINNWAVPITVEGMYSILVGPTRGNATYTLVVKS